MIPFTTALFGQVATGGGGGGTPPSATNGALVYRSANAALSANAAVLWDLEAYDDNAFHSTVTNTDRLTVPSGVSLVRILSAAGSATSSLWYMQKNGASFAGRGSGLVNSAGADNATPASGILAVSPTDYFTLHTTTALTILASGGTTVNDASSWFGIETFDAGQKYALLAKTGTQSITAASETALSWDSETADTDGFHDNATNNTRITIPSGVSLVRLSASVNFTAASGTGECQLKIWKNGAAFDGMGFREQQGNLTKVFGAHSALVAVTAGDYFEAVVNADTNGTVNNVGETWFGIEVVNPLTKRAVVRKASGGSVGNGVWATLSFDSEITDTDSFHDNSTNPSRLTVPSGVTQARVSFNLRANSAGQTVGRVIKNGATTIFEAGTPYNDSDTTSDDGCGGLGMWMSVTAGDYFELQGFGSTAGGLDNTCTWFAIECR